jgi:prophage regulatory protein
LYLDANNRAETQQMSKYVTDKQLAKRYGVHRATIWRWKSLGLLPAPEKLSPACTRWRLEDVERRDAERAANTLSAA